MSKTAITSSELTPPVGLLSTPKTSSQRTEESCVTGNIIVMIMNLWNCRLSVIKSRQFMPRWNGE